MPTVEDYAPLAPFTLDELVSAVNSILRDRPTLQLQGRTVRYYISNGLLPPPSGGPKFARYSVEHLRRVVFIRQSLDAGLTLEQAAEQLDEGQHGGKSEVFKKPAAPRISEAKKSAKPPSSPEPVTVRRYQLTPNTILEVTSNTNLEDEIPLIMETLRSFNDS